MCEDIAANEATDLLSDKDSGACACTFNKRNTPAMASSFKSGDVLLWGGSANRCANVPPMQRVTLSVSQCELYLTFVLYPSPALLCVHAKNVTNGCVRCGCRHMLPTRSPKAVQGKVVLQMCAFRFPFNLRSPVCNWLLWRCCSFAKSWASVNFKLTRQMPFDASIHWKWTAAACLWWSCRLLGWKHS